MKLCHSPGRGVGERRDASAPLRDLLEDGKALLLERTAADELGLEVLLVITSKVTGEQDVQEIAHRLLR